MSLAPPDGGLSKGPSGPDPMLVLFLGFLSAACLVAGLIPGYVFEMDGADGYALEERCPAPFGSESVVDRRCAIELISRGPLFLGKEYLAASFLSGGAALGGVVLVGRRALTQLVAALFLFVYLALGGVFFSSMAPGLVQGAFFLGVPVILGAILLARDSPRRATVLLPVTYVVAWASLLSWNAAEGHRLTGLGV